MSSLDAAGSGEIAYSDFIERLWRHVEVETEAAEAETAAAAAAEAKKRASSEAAVIDVLLQAVQAKRSLHGQTLDDPRALCA